MKVPKKNIKYDWDGHNPCPAGIAEAMLGKDEIEQTQKLFKFMAENDAFNLPFCGNWEIIKRPLRLMNATHEEYIAFTLGYITALMIREETR